MNPSKLFVGNLSWSMTQEDVENLFSEHGELAECQLVTHRDTGRSRGFAFVTYVNEEDAQKAIEALNETEIDGRPIRVSVAKPKVGGDRKPGGFRSNGGGGYRGGNNHRSDRAA